ncbi:hypothetical protein MUGA111182_04480 [Mucilaginibacter galii]|uniref:Coproporphyrinogen III oxidase n=1 Tax=Mucilaginibacter galii TaxID=2005073 RepID=A0A917JA03_9SPHI|nr:hypothetical protein [Mucilaginibacter galii]GGI50862.1 hypothetical protein GCM10011425_20740 [Mucilaginibacter galii]
MKKLAFTFLASLTIIFTACNSKSTGTTGGAMADSGAAGSSGPADTSMAAGSGAPVGVSTGGSDTSTTGSNSGVANPVTDTTGQKRP